jgi:hypothetical protein
MDATVLIGLLSLVFTLLVLSYVVGDNPAFRFAVHAFIGISAGYVTAIVVLQVIVNKMALPLAYGGLPEKILAGFGIICGLLLTLKIFARTEWFARWIVASLVGISAAAAMAGAVLGTIYPQTMATINIFQDPGSGAFILVGTVATLAYFQFTLFGKNASAGKRGWLMNIISLVGQVFIAITFGALFAGAFSAALTALIDRIQSVVLFFENLLKLF